MKDAMVKILVGLFVCAIINIGYSKSECSCDAVSKASKAGKKSITVKLTSFSVNDKEEFFGYKDQNGKIVIPAQYEMAGEFADGLAFVYNRKVGWCGINTKGEKLFTPFIFDNGPDYFSEGLARFVKDGKMGFFNKKGKIIISAKYDFVYPFKNGRAAYGNGCKEVKDGEHTMIKGGTWGYLNKKGKIVIKAKYSNAGQFERGKAQVQAKDGKRYIINKRGKIVKTIK